jgi:hypothetical protein
LSEEIISVSRLIRRAIVKKKEMFKFTFNQGHWKCEFKYGIGIGLTPKEAYFDWLFWNGCVH